MSQGIKVEIDPELLDSLTNKFSDTAIAKQLGCTISTVFLNRKKHGIKSFTEKTGSRISRKSGRILEVGQGEYFEKLTIDRQFFQSIDSEVKAYALGLIATDGFISYTSKGKYLGVELQMPDSVVLHAIALAIGADPSAAVSKIVREGKKPTERLRIYSRDLVEQLMELGITKATGDRQCFRSLPSHLARHYIRGLFDGDGSVFSAKSHLALSVSSRDLAYGLVELVNYHLGLISKVRVTSRNDKPFYVVNSWSKQPRKIIHWIYSDSTIAIPRKVKEATIWFSRF